MCYEICGKARGLIFQPIWMKINKINNVDFLRLSDEEKWLKILLEEIGKHCVWIRSDPYLKFSEDIHVL